MKTNEIAFIDSIIEQLYAQLIELKTFIGECKGENKAYELNRKAFRRIIGVNPQDIGDTPMQYKNIKLFKRKDNRWEARWQKNKVTYAVYGNTQLECYNKLKAKYESTLKNSEKQKKMMLYAWLDFWLTTYKSENISKENEIAIRLHIKKNLSDIELNKITQLQIIELLNKLKNTKRTCVTVYNVLNESLERAVQNKFITENPCKYIDRPKHSRVTGSALSIDEEAILINNIKGHASEHIIKFLLYSGARRGEALILDWADIDWDSNKIHVRGTKTESSDRYLPIFPKLRTLLEEIGVKENGKVFVYNNPCSITRSFIRLSGLKNHKLHDLRHTFATRCIEQDISMKYVQKWLGHSSYKTTADIYSHALNDRLEKELADKL